MSETDIIDIHCHYQKRDGYLEEMLGAAQDAGVRWLCLNGNAAEVLGL